MEGEVEGVNQMSFSLASLPLRTSWNSVLVGGDVICEDFFLLCALWEMGSSHFVHGWTCSELACNAIFRGLTM